MTTTKYRVAIIDEISKYINMIDPLQAKANLEDPEDVAYGVKQYIVQQINKEF